MSGFRKHIDAAVIKADSATRHITFIASQQIVDRDHEVIITRGIDLTEFALNPVLLCNHDRDFPFGRVTASRVETRKGVDTLVMEADILPAGTSERVDESWAALQAGARNAFSIGFIPVTVSRDPVVFGQTGVTYTETKLLEVSSVSLPSCPTCVVEAKRWKATGDGADAIVLMLDGPVTKEGRVLSRENRKKLRAVQYRIQQANFHCDAAMGHAQEILAADARPDDDDDEPTYPNPGDANPYSAATLEAFCNSLAPDAIAAITRTGRRTRHTEPFEPVVYDGDRETLRTAIWSEGRSALCDLVVEEVKRKLRRKSGRVD